MKTKKYGDTYAYVCSVRFMTIIRHLIEIFTTCVYILSWYKESNGMSMGLIQAETRDVGIV
jgi:hypothetical protein